MDHVAQILHHWELPPSSRLSLSRNFYVDLEEIAQFLTEATTLFATCSSASECAQTFPAHGRLLNNLCDSKSMSVQEVLKKPLLGCMLEFAKFRNKSDLGSVAQRARKWCTSKSQALAALDARNTQALAEIIDSFCHNPQLSEKLKDKVLLDLGDFLQQIDAANLPVSAPLFTEISEALVPFLSVESTNRAVDSLLAHLERHKIPVARLSPSFVSSLGERAAKVTFQTLTLKSRDALWKGYPLLIERSLASLLSDTLAEDRLWLLEQSRLGFWAQFADSSYLVENPGIFMEVWRILQEAVVQRKDVRLLLLAGTLWQYFITEWETRRIGSPLSRYFPDLLQGLCQKAQWSPENQGLLAEDFWELVRALPPAENDKSLPVVWFFLVSQRKFLQGCFLRAGEQGASRRLLCWSYFPDDAEERDALEAAILSLHHDAGQRSASLIKFVEAGALHRGILLQCVCLLRPQDAGLILDAFVGERSQPLDTVSLCLAAEIIEQHLSSSPPAKASLKKIVSLLESRRE